MDTAQMRADAERAKRYAVPGYLDSPFARSIVHGLADHVLALLAENEQLRVALQPFADYAAIVSEFADSRNPIGDCCPPALLPDPAQCRNAKPLPTLGHCRSAAELLAATEPNRTEG